MSELLRNTQDHLDELLQLTAKASRAISKIYDSQVLNVEHKLDGSPVTDADIAAHEILTKGLAALFPDVPVISEEGDEAVNKQTVLGDRYWLVDPLDGTKEFLKGTGEFTVCLGLIENGEPIYGVVGVPAKNTIYYGGRGVGSFKVSDDTVHEPIHVTSQPTHIVMGSVSHNEGATSEYIAKEYPHPETKIEALGSQLKFLSVAEGKADAYPRLKTSMKLWDVASGHAIVDGAGGSVTRPNGDPIDYRDDTLFIGDFITKSTPTT